MREANHLPVLPSGASEGQDTTRIEFFDPDFSPCSCTGRRHERTGLQAISVHQKLVRVSVGWHLYLWCYARVCEGCLRAWVTEPRLASSGGATATEYAVAAQWWEEQRLAGRRSYREHFDG